MVEVGIGYNAEILHASPYRFESKISKAPKQILFTKLFLTYLFIFTLYIEYHFFHSLILVQKQNTFNVSITT